MYAQFVAVDEKYQYLYEKYLNITERSQIFTLIESPDFEDVLAA